MSDRPRDGDNEAIIKAIVDQQPPNQRHPQRDTNTDDIHTPSINEPPGSNTQPWVTGEGPPPNSNTKELRPPNVEDHNKASSSTPAQNRS